MSKKRSAGRRTRSPAEHEFLRTEAWVRGAVRIGTSLTKWGGLAAIAYFISDAVKVWAGTATTAELSVVLELFRGYGVVCVLAVAIGIGGTLFGIRQAQLRRRTIESIAIRTPELERLLDSKRSSSGLTRSGDTPNSD